AAVGRGLVHRKVFSPVLFLSPSLRSTETSSVGAETAPRGAAGAKAFAPPRQARWGREPFAILLWCKSLRSTETSSVGAGTARARQPCAHRPYFCWDRRARTSLACC